MLNAFQQSTKSFEFFVQIYDLDHIINSDKFPDKKMSRSSAIFSVSIFIDQRLDSKCNDCLKQNRVITRDNVGIHPA